MNKAILMGRLTSDPTISYTNGAEAKAIARFNLAVQRSKDGADFISCKAFGKTAEMMEKFIKKGTKILVEGHISTGSYETKDGKKVYTTDVIVDRFEFTEVKMAETKPNDDGAFVPVPDDVDDGFLPFA